MSLSYASVAPGNLELSPMRIKFNSIDLGASLDNVVIAIEASKAEIKADQLGTTVIDRRVSGHKITVTTSLAETALKDNWKIALPWANLVTSGPNKSLYGASQVGLKDTDGAFQLLLHPLERADADLAGDFLMYKAVAEGITELTNGPEEQKKLKIVWNVLPDFTTSPVRFFLHGDPAVGLIAASAGSPSYTGTGNGTLTGVAVYSGVTRTETITATCVTAAVNGGVFAVSGSVSGALGLATVGIAFIPSGGDPAVISFTINDGSTDFIVGDQFTIATTAANYV